MVVLVDCDIINYVTQRETITNTTTHDISIGDLVRLNEDLLLRNGVGVVEDIKLNFDDLCHINYLLDKIEEHNLLTKTHPESNGFFSSKPQALILWSNKRLSKSNSMWIYTSEITVIHKVISPGDNR